MLKLNNKGWGLGIFLTFIGVFFIAIILIVYISNKYNLGIQNSVLNNESDANTEVEDSTEEETTIYKEYEIKVKESAITYQEKNYPNLSDGEIFYVNLKKLGINESIQNECDGYAVIKKENDIFYYEPFIKCGKYSTEGYSSAY